MDRIFAEAAKGAQSRKPMDDRTSEQQANGAAAAAAGATGSDGQALPNGVVIGPDGKPCRTCTKTSDWAKMFRSNMKAGSATGTSSSAAAAAANADAPTLPADCPPDVDRLGNHSWTLLHSISASYPERANPQQQNDMRNFLSLFGKLYPCWVCASDFQEWISRPENTPRTEGRDALGKWMCGAHNEVNRKLGKTEFDCSKWQERWRTGWKDGRCDL